GDRMNWNDFVLSVHECPGHTWYAAAYSADIDGQRAVFIGDELALNGRGKLRGNGPVFRNRVSVDSFMLSVQAMRGLRPDILLTGHDGAICVDEDGFEDALEWCRRLECAIRDLIAHSDEPDFALDRDVVNVHPYQAAGVGGGVVELQVEIRNHHSHNAKARVRV